MLYVSNISSIVECNFYAVDMRHVAVLLQWSQNRATFLRTPDLEPTFVSLDMHMYRRVYFTRIKYITLISRRRVKITRPHLCPDLATLVAQDDFALSGERRL